MKNIFFIFILISNLAASSRQDTTNLEFIKSSIKLTKAYGYSKNINLGKWIKNKNLLYDKVAESEMEKSFMFQNFDYIQLSKIEYNNNEYFILLSEKNNGYFKYPAIKKDWIAFKETIFIILTKKELEQIRNYISSPKEKEFVIKKSYKVATIINNRFKALGGEHGYTKEVLMAQISQLIKNIDNSDNDTKYFYYSFPLLSTIEDNKHVIRFKVPFLNNIKPTYNSIVKDAFPIRIETDSLEYDYFEIPVIEFQKILEI